MKKIRSIHSYLGCFFAPMLMFFAVSGIWQTLGLTRQSHLLSRLPTIHESFHLKTRDDLTNIYMMIFVLLMAVSFIVSVILGVVMALKYGGSKRAAFYCLSAGIVVPLGLVLIAALTR